MVEIKIYTLQNPINNTIFYVGRCATSLKTRMSGHLASLKNGEGNKNKCAVLKEIIDLGLFPIIEEIESFNCSCYEDERVVNDAEKYWICQFRAWGFTLTNSIGIKSIKYNNTPLLHWHKKEQMKKEVSKSLGNLKDKVVTASEIKISMGNATSNFDADRLNNFTGTSKLPYPLPYFDDPKMGKNDEQVSTVASWITEIENFCNEQGIRPQDLIESYKAGQSKVKVKKEAKIAKNEEETGKPSRSNWRESQRKAKCGF